MQLHGFAYDNYVSEHQLAPLSTVQLVDEGSVTEADWSGKVDR